MKKSLLVFAFTIGLMWHSQAEAGQKFQILKTQTTDIQDTITIKGKVKKIEFGKDGYTAQIIGAKKKVYFATISRSNLSNPSQYRQVKKGQTIQVKGDSWQMDNATHITVREIL